MRSPLTEMTPYTPGMQLQLQCFSPEHVRGQETLDMNEHTYPNVNLHVNEEKRQ